jgi:hypothetical protein
VTSEVSEHPYIDFEIRAVVKLVFTRARFWNVCAGFCNADEPPSPNSQLNIEAAALDWLVN